MRNFLMPMDIVVHEGKLWVVSTAHERNEQGLLVNLNGYKREDRKEKVLQSDCRIVKDMEERDRIGCDGFAFFPDTDFGKIEAGEQELTGNVTPQGE